MSPGPTFDRVYTALKEQLASGAWAPGAHLEPAAIGEELAASITPVRDALHRLVGERMIEAPRHDGFWVPALTEKELRELYAWRGDLLALALRRWRGAPANPLGGAARPDAAALFRGIARSSDNHELERAVAAVGARLAEYGAAERAALVDIDEEAARLATLAGSGDAVGLRGEIRRYHARRRQSASVILAERRRQPG